MKFIFRKTYIALLAALLVVNSCDIKDFGDTNVNPNEPYVPKTSALLTNVLTQVGGFSANTTTGLYAQYFSETQYPDVQNYAIQNINWSGFYTATLMDLQRIIDINTDPNLKKAAETEGSNANQLAVARILKAYIYSYLTDRYGDVPYSEACKNNERPKFDTQESIYNDLFKELDEAVGQFDSGAVAVGDILFNGDIDAWKRFANSYRAILALRVAKVNPTLGKAQFQAALAADGGVISSNAENVVINYPGGTFKNPWYNLYNGRSDFSISNTIAKELNAGKSSGVEDFRYWTFGHVTGFTASGLLIPIPGMNDNFYGMTREEVIAYTNANPGWSKILHSSLRAEDSPLPVLTYSDIALARAEAANRGWTTENVKNWYLEGVKASWIQWDEMIGLGWTISGAGYDFEADWFTPHMEQASKAVVGTPGDAADLAKICTQRWIAAYPNGSQGWAIWRSTGFPSLTPSRRDVVGAGIPRKYIFPTVEKNLNPAGYNEAVARLGGTDAPDKRVWWDKQ